MSALGNITFDIESVCKVVCLNTQCKYNLMKTVGAYCGLKNIRIDEAGCASFERIADKPVEKIKP